MIPTSFRRTLFVASLVAVIAASFAGSVLADDYASPAATPKISPPLRMVEPLLVPRSEIVTLVKNRYRQPPPGAVLPTPVVDAAIQTSPASLAPTAVAGLNFDGVPVGNSAPPDTTGTVGKDHYVQMVNTRWAIYDKRTAALKYGPVNIKTLWQFLGGTCAKHNNGDPVAIYDRMADRYVLSQFAVAAADGYSHQCVAISMSGDPLGSYFLYDFKTDVDDFVDYPHMSVWTDAYYMAAHLFTETGTDSGLQLFAFEREAMLAGMPARLVRSEPNYPITVAPLAPWGGLPADIDSLTPPPPGAKALFIAGGNPSPLNGNGGQPRLHVWTVSTNWPATGTPTMTVSAATNLTVTPYNSEVCSYSIAATVSPLGTRPCVPQPPPAQPPAVPAPGSVPSTGLPVTDWLDVMSDRLMFRVAYRNMGTHEAFVLNQTVAGAPNQAAVRWYELRRTGATPTANGTVTLHQEGTFAGPTGPDAESRWMGSIAMDNSGNIALGYSKSSLVTMPQIAVTGRLSTDAAGTMAGETIMMNSGGIQQGTAGRWGDYSHMSVDAHDGCTFWYSSQYIPTTGQFNWRTRIAAFKFPSCAAPAQGMIQGTVVDSQFGTPVPGALVSAGTFSAGTDAGGRYSMIVPPGNYTLTATSPVHNCSTNVTGTKNVVLANGGSITENFLLTGTPKIEFGSYTIDDGIGNGNGSINKGECANLVVTLANNGCDKASGITSTITSTTPGVTIDQGTSAFPEIGINSTGSTLTPFKLTTSPTFVCGTTITLEMLVTMGATNKTFVMNVPTCAAAPTEHLNQALAAADPDQQVRLGRNSIASLCDATKVCPAAITGGTGTRNFDQYTFTNTAAVKACVNVHIDVPAGTCTGTNEIQSAAYRTSFDPANLCTNYIADSGSSPNLGFTDYSFEIDPGVTFVVTVNGVQEGGVCPNYNLVVSGLIDQTPGVCRLATSTAVVSNINPSVADESVTFTATVAPLSGPTGTVSFKEGVTTLGTAPVNGGIATFTTSTLTVGSHPIKAIYSGDATYGASTSATLTQIVNSAPVGAFAFTSPAHSAGEGEGTKTIAVQRVGGSSGSASVNYAVTGGTASATDYTLPAGVLSFADGETVKSISVLITDDQDPEEPETLAITLSNPTGGSTITTPSATTLTIVDNDGVLPVINSLNPSQVCEGSPTITVTVNGANFDNGAVVLVDGAERNTTFGGATVLTVEIPASDLANARPVPVRVLNSDQRSSATSTLNVVADAIPPTVAAPATVLVMQSMCDADGNGGATSATSSALAAFLAGGSATDNCTATPTRLAAQISGVDVTSATVFRPGVTPVTFRHQDGKGNVGTAGSSVTVRLYNDLDLDNSVSATDLVLLANYLVGNATPESANGFTAPLGSADLNRDANVNAVDIVIAANNLVGNIACLPTN